MPIKDRSYKTNPEFAIRDTNNRFRRLYGITKDQRDELVRRQDGKCEICGDLFILLPGTNGVNIDHDHATGKIRGLLCASCNRGLGQFKDSTKRIEQALAYLNKHAHT